MPFISRLTDTFTHIKNEVSGFINPHTENSPTSGVTSAQSPPIHDLTNDSPEPSPSNRVATKFRTRAVPALIDEDDEEHRIQESDQASSDNIVSPLPLSSPSTRQSSFRSTHRNERARYQREVSSPEERRALGVAEPSPRDAIKITLPKSGSSPAMPLRKPFSGFLKPMNGIADPPRSHKTILLQEKRNKQGSIASPSKIRSTHKFSQAQNEKTLRRENDHTVPNKRPRLNEPRQKLSQAPSTISIDSTDEDDTLQQRHEPTHPVDLVSMAVSEEIEVLDGHPRKRFFNPHNNSTPLQELNASQVGDRDIRNLERFIHSEASSTIEPPATVSMTPYKPGTGQAYQGRIDSHFQTPWSSSVRTTSSQVPADDSPDELQAATTTKQIQASRLHILNKIKKRKQSNLSSEEGRLLHLEDLSDFQPQKYPLKSILIYEGIDVTEFELVLCQPLQHFWIFVKGSLLDPEAVLNIPLSKIPNKVEWCPNNSKIILHLSAGVLAQSKLHLEFQTLKGSRDFVTEIQGRTNIKISEKDDVYMAKAFHLFKEKFLKSGTTRHSYLVDTDRGVVQTPIAASETISRPHSSRREKLVDKLDSPDPVDVVRSATQSLQSTGSTLQARSRKRRSSPLSIHNSIESPYFSGTQSSRATRAFSARHRDTTVAEQEPRNHDHKVSHLITVKSSKPLTLYGPLRKSESLSQDDFHRLDEDEFLNDNLISFFLLYLQKIANPAQLRRMHFFNTFFYSTLTKDAKGKANIKYDAVARWTRKIDLFNRDFVIVPVNDNFHWFVMIICNLPVLKAKPVDSISSRDCINEDQTNKEDEEQLQPTSSDIVSPESARESFQELSLSEPVGVVDRLRDNGTHRKGRKHNFRAKRYDVHKPVIITLDSLDHNRSATATQLKKYIVSLAADPDQTGVPFQVDANSIPGMTAKDIPHQKNFSDCGLYLCMYMEQFMRDPDTFVRRVLRRETGGQRWPKNITGRQLREKLALLINGLYKQQVDASLDNSLPDLGSILIDMLPAEEETEFSAPATHPDVTNDQVVEVPQSPPPVARAEKHHTAAILKDADTNQNGSSPAIHASATSRNVPFEIFDHEPSPSVRELGTIAKVPAISAVESITIADDTRTVAGYQDPEVLELDTHDQDNPSLLAARLAQQRSPSKHQSIEIEEVDDQPLRTQRSDSVSTDFLAGNFSYVMVEGKGKRRRSKSSSTQQSPRALRSYLRNQNVDDQADEVSVLCPTTITTEAIEYDDDHRKRRKRRYTPDVGTIANVDDEEESDNAMLV